MTVQAVDQIEERPSSRIRRVVAMLLAAQEMKHEALVPVLGISRSAVYERMNGTRSFTVDDVAALADYFHAPVGMFFAGPDAMLGRGRSTQETFGREPGRETRKSLHATYPGIGPRLARLAA
jgi:hypothetical protein